MDDILRSLRGGSSNDLSWYCRSTCRGRGQPDYADSNVGFRVVRITPLAGHALRLEEQVDG